MFNRNQTLAGTAIDHTHEPQLRAIVKRNAYDAQSYQKVEAWTAAGGWAEIMALPIEESLIADYDYVSRKDWEPAMNVDLDRLLDMGRRFFD